MYSKEEILYYLNYMLQCLTLKETDALKSLKIMIQARNFSYAVNAENMNISLAFDFSGSAETNQVIITYCPAPDVFKMAWNKKTEAGGYLLVQEHTDVHFDEMKERFYTVTRLETRLSNISIMQR